MWLNDNDRAARTFENLNKPLKNMEFKWKRSYLLSPNREKGIENVTGGKPSNDMVTTVKISNETKVY